MAEMRLYSPVLANHMYDFLLSDRSVGNPKTNIILIMGGVWSVVLKRWIRYLLIQAELRFLPWLGGVLLGGAALAALGMLFLVFLSLPDAAQPSLLWRGLQSLQILFDDTLVYLTGIGLFWRLVLFIALIGGFLLAYRQSTDLALLRLKHDPDGRWQWILLALSGLFAWIAAFLSYYIFAMHSVRLMGALMLYLEGAVIPCLLALAILRGRSRVRAVLPILRRRLLRQQVFTFLGTVTVFLILILLGAEI